MKTWAGAILSWLQIDVYVTSVVAADCPLFPDCKFECCHGNAQVPMKGVQGKAFSLVEVITEAYG